jgi:ADP-L-glycero-D-manno-heptose 6-epimerase
MWIVTGATGFIGSAMVWELNQHGESDILLCDHVKPEDRPGLVKKLKFTNFIPADQLFDHLNSPQVRSKVRGIYHIGACSTTTETDEQYLQKNNVEYTQKIFEFCAANGIPLIYASSAATYGDGKLGFDDATDPSLFKPLNLYGWSKLKSDIWALKQTKTPPRWYGLRFFNVYGPNEYHKGEQASVVFKAYKQIMEHGRLKLFRSHDPKYRDGEQLRDFVYVKDVTRWMHELMHREQSRSGVYNIGSGRARTWLDLANNTFLSLGRETQIDWIEIPANIRNQYQYFTEAKIDRLLNEGVTKAQWPLEAGIQDYVAHYLKQEDPYL